VYLFWRVLILADLADCIKICHIKYPPKLNKNNNFLDKKAFFSVHCAIEAFDIIIDDED